MAYYDNDDTIFAPATVPGTGAITLIRVSGPAALSIADSVVRCGKVAAPGVSGAADASCGAESGSVSDGVSGSGKGPIASAKGYSIRFGSVYLPGGELLDEVLVSVFHAPHSYTGEDSVEISCHASSYIVSELSALLVAAGARPAEAGEFTRRAFLNGKMDLTQAEAVADVIASTSAAAHRVALSQMKGGFSSELASLRDQLLEIVSLMELELDFSEEEVEFADRSQLSTLLDTTLSHVGRLADSFRLGNAIKNGVPTAIVGATNVGKSTLLNALLGEDRAIVSSVHGTTRDTIEETLNLDGIVFRFVDTAGLRDTSEAVEKIGIERTYKKIEEAEIVLGMVDATRPQPQIKAEADKIISLVDPSRQTLFMIINKIDAAQDADFLAASSPDQQENTDAGTTLMLGTTNTNFPDSTELRENGDIQKSGSEISLEMSGKEPCNKDVNTVDTIVSYIENKGVSVFPISAKTQTGLDALRAALTASQKDKIDSAAGSVLVTNLRHYQALRSAAASLTRVKEGLATGIPTDLVAQDIREAIDTLGSLTGELTINSADVLNSIFSRFCIGK